MNAHSLILFVDIMEAGNLSSATQNVKMSRANTNYRLAQPGKSVGQQLMWRMTRCVGLIEIGQHLYQHERVVRDGLMTAQESVVAFGKMLQGPVRLSMPAGFGHMVASDWPIEFKRQYPDIALDLLLDNRVDDLPWNEVDVAVRAMSEPSQQTVTTELARIRYVTYASTSYSDACSMPVTLEDLGRAPLITSTVAGHNLRASAHQGEQYHELVLHPTLISESSQFLHKAILAGLGIGLVPNYVVEQNSAEGHMSTTLNDWRSSVFDTHMFLLHMLNHYRILATRTLISFVVEKARIWAS